jgi:histone acetyltransferase 1
VQATPDGLRSVTEFNPDFTYPIFGEAEQIFGYKGLEIDLRFAAHDLRPNVQISYEKRFKAVGDTSALDLNKTLKQYLPPVAFEANFENVLKDDAAAKEWQPPGEMVTTYTRDGDKFEIWAASLSDPRMKALVDNIQIFILFFIEGGQFLNLDDVAWTLDRWRVYLTYKVSSSPSETSSPYSFIGYATTYRFYRFQPSKAQADSSQATSRFLEAFPAQTEFSAKMLSSRLRISQFLILPQYQRGGHGSALYNAIYSDAMADDTISELTVEDPSEEFDKLRDINDFKTLRPEFEKAGLKLNTEPFAQAARGRIRKVPTATLLPISALKNIRKQYKIAARQFARLTELYLLANIGFSHRQLGGANLVKLKMAGARAADPNDRSYYWWRVLLKQRIFKKNKDVLIQLPPEERVSKVEDSASGQEDEYEGILLLHGKSLQKDEARNGNGSTDGGPSSSRKRKVIEDEDDEDDHDSEDASLKRQKG